MAEKSKKPSKEAKPATPKAEAASGAGAAQAAPQIMVMAQYIKDLSFENPRAPQHFAPGQDAPQVSINVNVSAAALAEDQYEVTLSMEATAMQETDTVFVIELVYSGVFGLGSVDENQRQMMLLIECPRLLFPFARNIVADVTRDGGFPPLLIQPIDFVALYQRQQAEAGAAGTA